MSMVPLVLSVPSLSFYVFHSTNVIVCIVTNVFLGTTKSYVITVDSLSHACDAGFM